VGTHLSFIVCTSRLDSPPKFTHTHTHTHTQHTHNTHTTHTQASSLLYPTRHKFTDKTNIYLYAMLWLLGIDTYACSWPTTEVIQLRCDFINCPYLSVDHITVGRLQGNPSSCSHLNSNATLRRPIPSCNYQLMESHDFYG